MFDELTDAERSDDLNPVERFGCRPFSHDISKRSGRCYFAAIGEDLCHFPFARNWLRAGCEGGWGRHDPVKIKDLASCPLTDVGSGHLAEVNHSIRYAQRGPYRVQVRNGRLQWDMAEICPTGSRVAI